MFTAVQHERATRTFIKQKSPSFLHHPHHGTHHPSIAASLTGSLHHSIPHSTSLHSSPTNTDVSQNLSSFASLTGLPVNNVAAAALLAAHGHNSASTNPYHSSNLGNFHNQSSHHLGAPGMIPSLSQYFSSEAVRTGSANGAFSSYNPLAAHLKAAFPSIFPQLYIHTHQPPIFSPPPMIPPPPLISPQKTILSHNISSSLLRSSPSTHVPSSLVAREDERKQREEASSKADLSKEAKMECDGEQNHANQPFLDRRKTDVQEGNSTTSTPNSCKNNMSDDALVLKKQNVSSLSHAPNLNKTNDCNGTEGCGKEKLDSILPKKEQNVSKKELKEGIEKISDGERKNETRGNNGMYGEKRWNYEDVVIRNDDKEDIESKTGNGESIKKDETFENDKGMASIYLLDVISILYKFFGHNVFYVYSIFS